MVDVSQRLLIGAHGLFSSTLLGAPTVPAASMTCHTGRLVLHPIYSRKYPFPDLLRHSDVLLVLLPALTRIRTHKLPSNIFIPGVPGSLFFYKSALLRRFCNHLRNILRNCHFSLFCGFFYSLFELRAHDRCDTLFLHATKVYEHIRIKQAKVQNL